MAERVVGFLRDAGSERHSHPRAGTSIATLECQARHSVARGAESRGDSEVERFVARPPVIFRLRSPLDENDGQPTAQAHDADFQPVHGGAEVLGCPR